MHDKGLVGYKAKPTWVIPLASTWAWLRLRQQPQSRNYLKLHWHFPFPPTIYTPHAPPLLLLLLHLPKQTVSHFQNRNLKKKKKKKTEPTLFLFPHSLVFWLIMSASTGSSKIRRIVRVRQMLLRWRRKAAADVPAGHVAVCVGPSRRRFIVRATHLNHPIFKMLLVKAEEEYGFCNHGPLAIPCDESLFEHLLRVVARPVPLPGFSSLEDFQTRCHVDFVGGESWPLLRDEPICWKYINR